MPNLVSFGVLHSLVTNKKESADLSHLGAAFNHIALQLILKLNEDEAEDAITDGSDDGGIDAIYLTENEVHFFNFKYTWEPENTEKNFPGAKVDKLSTTINQIMQGQLIRETINQAVWDYYRNIIDMIKSTPRIKFHVHLASNKMKPSKNTKDRLRQPLDQYRYFNYHYYNLEDLAKLILEGDIGKKDGTLTFQGKDHFEKSDGPVKTLIGVVAAKDLIELIKDRNDPNKVDECIFNENVRTYKPTHPVNRAIMQSAMDENNYRFFYLNNGITILCEECSYTPNIRSPRLELKNLQIINGGQTSHSLFQVYKKDSSKIRTIDILVRICIAKKDDPISSEISESSNKQIPVGTRDLHSNDDVQRKIQAEFKSKGYFYERKPNEFKDLTGIEIISNELLGQLCLAYKFDMPSEAKNSKTLVFGSMYTKIFDEEEISADFLLHLYNLYKPIATIKKDIQNRKRRREPVNEKEAFISRGLFHILNGMKLIAKHDGLDLFDAQIQTSVRDRSIKLIYEVVQQEIDKRGELYTHDKFFKEVPTNSIIKSYIIKQLNLTSG